VACSSMWILLSRIMRKGRGRQRKGDIRLRRIMGAGGGKTGGCFWELRALPSLRPPPLLNINMIIPGLYILLPFLSIPWKP
jgi:hypothetical protein